MPFQKGHKFSGGHVKSERKTITARENGRKGGRPKDGKYKVVYFSEKRQKEIAKFYRYKDSAYNEAYKRAGEVYEDGSLIYRVIFYDVKQTKLSRG